MLDLYSRIDAILYEHKCINKKAMALSHSLGYNGFKRMHRKDSKKYFKWCVDLENELFDKYRTKMTYTHRDYAYNPSTLKDHLANWDSKLIEAITELGKINKEHIDRTGVSNCIIEKALCKMIKRYEKTGRWYKRFEEGGWLAFDQHAVDDYIHKKFKKKEGK